MSDKVSIIVPIYNVEKYLPKCIESIINQTYKNLEIILVDDGSPDNCAKICDEYAKKDNRIKVIHKPNGGVSSARNAGLDIATGEYIGFVDPDDFIAPEMYEQMLEAIKTANADLAICGYDYFDEDGNLDKKRLYEIRETEILTRKEVIRRFSDMPPTIRHGVVNKLFKSELLSLKFKEGLHSSEDVLFLNEYAQKIKNACFIHKPFYKNTVRQGSATHGGLSIKSLRESFEAHLAMYSATVTLYPDLRNHSLAFLLDVCTLKYNEAVAKFKFLSENEKISQKKYLLQMRKVIKKHALKAILNSEIYWKTRIYYVVL